VGGVHGASHITSMVPHCGRRKRREVVECELPEEVKRLLYRWKSGVCLACVDELAEKGRDSLPPGEPGGDDLVRSLTGAAEASSARTMTTK
jgi:hypothetical protein